MKKPPIFPVGRTRRWTRRLAASGVALALSAGVVWGVWRLGYEARREVWPRDRYRARFADIDCDPPPGRDRAAFLAEVRYLANYPDTYHALDPNLSVVLAAAFAKHPWVAGCDHVSVDPKGIVRVKLTYRVPVLAVHTPAGIRIVDRTGVLLPLDAKDSGLPELISKQAAPGGPAGQVWNNDDIARAVELVDAHGPRILEKTADGWRLILRDGHILKLEK